jgi:hypothetical protein
MVKQFLTIGFIAAGLAATLALPACHKQPSASANKNLSPEQKKLQEKVKVDRGLPMRLVLPEDSNTPEDLDLVQPMYNQGNTTWSAPFVYPFGFEKVVASFDEQLKSQGFMRLVSDDLDIDPGFKMGDLQKPVRASGKKTWISKDKRILAALSYEYRRGDKGGEESHEYHLGVMRSDMPQEIKPPLKLEAIP